MNKQYNILWLDDQFETLQNIRRAAKIEGIILTPFKSFEEGFEHLKNNMNRYDGILLDALFYDSKDQVAGTEDSKGLIKAIDKINELKHKKVFPYFVLSGQRAYTNQESEILKNRNIRCYLKAERQDWLELFEDIKVQADKLHDTQLKHKYADAFAACTDDYVGENIHDSLLEMLRTLDNNDLDDSHFNSGRKIIEGLFKALNRHKLLPDAFVENGVNLTAASKFFAGKEALGYTLKQESKLPLSICDELYFVLHIVQSGSHSSDLTDRLKQQNTSYLTIATINIMLDILVWFKDYIDSEPVKENWSDGDSDSSEWMTGTVKVLNGMYSFNNSDGSIMVPSTFTDGLNDGDQVEVHKSKSKSRKIISLRKRR